MSVFKKKNKNGTTSYGYDFRDRVTGTRYRKIVPLAHTKWDAEQAETAAKKELLRSDLELRKRELHCFLSSLIRFTSHGPKLTRSPGAMMSTCSQC
jgi:hypothetical protein